MSGESLLLRLPNDTAHAVFQFLDMEDLLALYNTCKVIRAKYFRSYFWKSKLLIPGEDIEVIMRRLKSRCQDNLQSDFQLAMKWIYPLRKGILSKYEKFHGMFLI